ncbi:hypothetical protein NDU88_004686 [Pleurodeles waltl]|uniref:Uncharacterized protein n=1 Tax=Pleurodeles waltl TaxID=8319 RepID=A0AAV7PDA1_PLEWA|nr:hypothetical protein NDU88_004686 [Pleurodeles waltl]
MLLAAGLLETGLADERGLRQWRLRHPLASLAWLAGPTVPRHSLPPCVAECGLSWRGVGLPDDDCSGRCHFAVSVCTLAVGIVWCLALPGSCDWCA